MCKNVLLSYAEFAKLKDALSICFIFLLFSPYIFSQVLCIDIDLKKSHTVFGNTGFTKFLLENALDVIGKNALPENKP